MLRWIRLGIVLAVLIAGRYSAAQTNSELIFLRAGQQAELGYGDLYAYAPGQPESERLTTNHYDQSYRLTENG